MPALITFWVLDSKLNFYKKETKEKKHKCNILKNRFEYRYILVYFFVNSFDCDKHL